MIHYSMISFPGDRPVNEDSIGAFTKDNKACFILCDGLGGHGMGDTASQLVVKVFEDLFQKSDDMTNFIGQAFMASESLLLMEQQQKHIKDKMKTTGVTLLIDDDVAHIGHVGDSRLYVFKWNRVKMRTIDHSVPQMLVKSREIKESEIRYHPDRNLLLRVLGVDWDEPMYELSEPLKLKKCQAFLLCSDGFWELIEEKEMCSLLKHSSSVEEWLSKMTEVVEANGIGKDMDNFSAIAIWND